MRKYIFFLLALILISLSITFQILYLNLFSIGYSIGDYLLFILKRIECLLFIPGIIILIINFKTKN